jgi:predicted amidohydrolase YtcJ
MTRPTNPLILHGCPIHPGGGRAPVEAIAIDGDRIVATGSLGEVRAAVGGAAYEKQLSGGALLPAFADPHQHAFLVAADPNVDVLHGCADIPDLLTRVAEIARSGMPSGWVRVHGLPAAGPGGASQPDGGRSRQRLQRSAGPCARSDLSRVRRQLGWLGCTRHHPHDP